MKEEILERRNYVDKHTRMTTMELELVKHKEHIVFDKDLQEYYMPLEYLHSIVHLPDYPVIYDAIVKELRERNKPYLKTNPGIKYLDEM